LSSTNETKTLTINSKVWLNNSDHGFSVIEVLLAVTFFSVVVTTLVGGIIYGNNLPFGW
jgi:hypothetical protein